MNKTTRAWQAINFTFYLKFIFLPLIIGVIIELFLRWLIDWLGLGWNMNQVDLSAWLVRLAVFGYLARKIYLLYGSVLPMGLIAGLEAGFIFGLVASGYRFIDGFKIWKIFNLVTESFFGALVGALSVFVILYLAEFFPFWNKHKNKIN